MTDRDAEMYTHSPKTMQQMRDAITSEIPRLRRRARRLTQEDYDAEDLLQQTLFLAIAKSHQFKPGTKLDRWLLTIMRNCCINNLREHYARTRRHTEFAQRVGLLDAAIPQLEWERAYDAWRAFKRLSDGEREMLQMVGVDGLSYQDVANRLDIALGTVRSRTHRARTALAQLCDYRR